MTLVGRTVLHYQILEKLGEGGMGVVYRARDTHLGRVVALKILPAEALAKPDRRLRFIQEARTASALNHPNIVTIHDIDSCDGTDFIAMEYVPGKTLDSWIGRKGLKIADVLKLSVQIADAVAAAHAAGVVHRDLKPSNVMVTENGVAKVLDFGLAKLTERTSGDADALETESMEQKPKTEEGLIVGTVAYMSPEQAEGRPVDARSDIFSFGSVLYEMVTGRRAFQRESKLSTLSAILRDQPAAAGTIKPDVPHDLETIINRCLRKDPDRRFQHMADVKIAIEELKEQSDSGTLPLPGQAAPAKPSRWVMWAAGGAAVLVLAGIGIWMRFIRQISAPAGIPVPVPLTSYQGFAASPSFSPDGDRVAFVWDGPKQDNLDIYVKLIGEDQPVRLTSDPAPDDVPAWSPDGHWIAFARWLSGNKSGVFLIPAIGGAEHKLTEVEGGGRISWHPGGDRICWHPGGRWLLVSHKNSAQEPLALFLVSVETGEKQRLTAPPEHSVGDTDPAVSPDGRALVFTRSVTAMVSDLYLLELSQDLRPVGDAKRITFLQGCTHEPAWWPDGNSILFSSGGSCLDVAFWRMAIRGPARRLGEPERLPFGAEGWGHSPAISRQCRVAYMQGLLTAHIQRLELDGSHRVEKMPMNSARVDHVPQYSPDGKRIAFLSNRSGSFEVWVCNADGSNTMKLTSFGGPYVASHAWSPDGRRIAVDARTGGASEIYIVGADRGKPKRLVGSRREDGLRTWSRDGKWIYVGSDRSGSAQVWKIPVDGGAAVQITKQGGDGYAAESPDGKFVYYTRSTEQGESTELWQVPAGGGEEIRIAGGVAPQFFSVVERGIYFFSGWDNPLVRRFNFASRRVETVVKVNDGYMAWGLSVSNDSRWLLYSAEKVESNLMLVESFR